MADFTVMTAVFRNAFDADQAIARLRRDMFLPGDISVLASNSTSEHAFAVQTGSKAGEGAAIGAGVGGALAAIIAGLTAVGVVASGGIGLVAAGPIVAALAGAGAGATAGGLVGGLIGLGVPEHEAKYYDDVVKEGGILVGVKTPNSRKDEVQRIFKECGAESVSRA